VEEVHGRSQDVGRLKTSLGWSMCEIKSGLQPFNEVECQGDDKTGDKLCQRWDKVNKFIGQR
jgi:hypothetical protein